MSKPLLAEFDIHQRLESCATLCWVSKIFLALDISILTSIQPSIFHLSLPRVLSSPRFSTSPPLTTIPHRFSTFSKACLHPLLCFYYSAMKSTCSQTLVIRAFKQGSKVDFSDLLFVPCTLSTLSTPF